MPVQLHALRGVLERFKEVLGCRTSSKRSTEEHIVTDFLSAHESNEARQLGNVGAICEPVELHCEIWRTAGDHWAEQDSERAELSCRTWMNDLRYVPPRKLTYGDGCTQLTYPTEHVSRTLAK